jgi:hypothetical protein
MYKIDPSIKKKIVDESNINYKIDIIIIRFKGKKVVGYKTPGASGEVIFNFYKLLTIKNLGIVSILFINK